MSNRVRQFPLLIAGVAALLFVGGCAGIANKLVHRPTAAATQPYSLPPDPAPIGLESLDAHRKLRIQVSPPAASLAIWIFDPRSSAPVKDAATRPTSATTTAAAKLRGTIIVLHGITGTKESMFEFGERFAQAGYRAVLVDLRAHGESTGEFMSYGVVESQDLVQLLDELARRGELRGPVGVYGHSYGGAVAIQLAARDPRVRAVVASSAFTSMRDVVPHIVLMYTSPLMRPFVWIGIQPTITSAGKIAGFNPDDASPLAAIQKTDAEVLLIHAKGDSFIPYDHAQRLHDAAPSHSELILLEGQEHNAMLFDPLAAQTANQAIEWFNRWLH